MIMVVYKVDSKWIAEGVGERLITSVNAIYSEDRFSGDIEGICNILEELKAANDLDTGKIITVLVDKKLYGVIVKKCNEYIKDIEKLYKIAESNKLPVSFVIARQKFSKLCVFDE